MLVLHSLFRPFAFHLQAVTTVQQKSDGYNQPGWNQNKKASPNQFSEIADQEYYYTPQSVAAFTEYKPTKFQLLAELNLGCHADYRPLLFQSLPQF